MSKKILLLNGPNLNLLGTRETNIYGTATLPVIEQKIIDIVQHQQIECEAFQSNSEGGLIDWLHTQQGSDFLILNPGAYTHTSVALRDAVLGINIPFIEVHISNVFKREPFRHHSYFSDIAIGSVIGLGLCGYEVAARYAIDYLQRS
ncbi:MAG: type II 3-dehydroquinate dehydratase [SAR324 cluster bacterium]|nr:type II 3-dehydroquinate dehydratase [SAR324 cluster bacterium]